ncbi:putative Transcriptional regulator, AraC family [Planktothrix sp. PCC 11201]|nr:putative Transcriptional regulator, AraC family [Planktothrix sp. PCC 11201]
MRDEFNPFCLHQLFEDFDQWTEAFKTWNLTANQLSQGKFKGELAIAQFGCLQLIYASANQAMQIVGDKPPNTLTFGTLLTSQDQELIAHNQRLNQKVLFGLDPTRETYIINQKLCRVGIVVVSTNVFHQYTDLMKYKSFNDTFFHKNIVHIDPNKLSNFKTYLQQLFYLLQTNPTWLQQLQTQKLIVEDCLPLLIDTLRFDQDFFDSGIPKLGRYQMIKEVEDFMIANIDQPLTLKDLYTAVKTSPRTLSYGVHDLFGMSPMEYLKIKRLNGVRRTLKTCDPNQTTISGIATHWGFWSMGHFSRDYKQLFGELPSETLKKTWEGES